MAKEGMTDDFITRLLRESSIEYTIRSGITAEIKDALKCASKRGADSIGYPDFTAKVEDFIFVGEDKADLALHIKYENDGETLAMDWKTISKFAVNGAVHYAKHIIKKTSFDKVFAFGCSGDEKRYKITPVFIDKSEEPMVLPDVGNFQNFMQENIGKYYREQVLGEKPQEQIELEEILSKAKELHEALRNLGQLGETEKPLVVSAILLALSDNKNFNISSLNGDKTKTDGKKIYDAVETYLTKADVSPESKKEKVLEQFNLIKNDTKLNEIDNDGETPLRHFTKYINRNVSERIKNSPEDILGRFYGEFMKYSGGDGKGLGVF